MLKTLLDLIAKLTVLPPIKYNIKHIKKFAMLCNFTSNIEKNLRLKYYLIECTGFKTFSIARIKSFAWQLIILFYFNLYYLFGSSTALLKHTFVVNHLKQQEPKKSEKKGLRKLTP